jgi:putative flippase GtrA
MEPLIDTLTDTPSQAVAAPLPKVSLLRALPGSAADGWRFFRTNGVAASFTAFSSRDAHPVLQFVKYGICGAGALVLHTTVFSLLGQHLFPMGQELAPSLRAEHSMINNGIAFLFSNTLVYWLNTQWVFTPGRHSKWLEFITFTLVNAPGAIAGTAIMAYLLNNLHWPTPLAFAGFVLPNVLINFLCRKFFIFKK